MIEPGKVGKIYDYLRGVETDPLEHADGAFVFCRASPLVAGRVAELFDQDLVGYALFTGGVGKDSGYLAELGLPEAVYQAALLGVNHGVSGEDIFVEPEATNGGDNSRFGIDKIVEKGLPHRDLTIVIHPTTLRRILATHTIIADNEKGFEANYQATGTHYEFDPRNPIDQLEACAELVRLDVWPGKGWAYPQDDLPEDLLEYAREAIQIL